jgi:hypothetical protein
MRPSFEANFFPAHIELRKLLENGDVEGEEQLVTYVALMQCQRLSRARAVVEFYDSIFGGLACHEKE